MKNSNPFSLHHMHFLEIESHWHTMQMELFVVKWALEQFRPYISGTKIKIVIDHTNLQWLTSVKRQQSKLAHWSLSMSEFDFYIEHKPGKQNNSLPFACYT